MADLKKKLDLMELEKFPAEREYHRNCVKPAWSLCVI